MTETMAPTHINPGDRPKAHCLGIPIFDTDARIIDPQTLAELPQGAVGEIIVSGPQVLEEYWNKPEENATCFLVRRRQEIPAHGRPRARRRRRVLPLRRSPQAHDQRRGFQGMARRG